MYGGTAFAFSQCVEVRVSVVDGTDDGGGGDGDDGDGSDCDDVGDTDDTGWRMRMYD